MYKVMMLIMLGVIAVGSMGTAYWTYRGVREAVIFDSQANTPASVTISPTIPNDMLPSAPTPPNHDSEESGITPLLWL